MTSTEAGLGREKPFSFLKQLFVKQLTFVLLEAPAYSGLRGKMSLLGCPDSKTGIEDSPSWLSTLSCALAFVQAVKLAERILMRF